MPGVSFHAPGGPFVPLGPRGRPGGCGEDVGLPGAVSDCGFGGGQPGAADDPGSSVKSTLPKMGGPVKPVFWWP